MAEKTERLERTYTIPLRKQLKVARWRRANKSISLIKNFMIRHMKAETVKIGKELNELIWERGGKKVPSKVKVTALREDDVVNVNLAGIAVKEEKKEKKSIFKRKEAKKEEGPEVKKKEGKAAEKPAEKSKKEVKVKETKK